MTPLHLTANEKVTDLDTPIASAAILPGALLLGVLLTGPARLALVPLGGGSAHVVELGLESPQEIALLAPDAALVRTADGAVWALANLTGEARPKVIARDIRSLHARPAGVHALGIGVDGSATAFSITRGAVSARTFTARGGALRAADVDEHVTYVIAEGEAGGVFRIHPGATPELGTSARADLPIEAAGLDRLRGGAALAAVFKRGEAGLAVITGGPRRFDAKLVQVGGNVADAAVIGSSLAVVFLDGRAALYDEAAIAAAAASAVIAPVSEIALGTRGRPRVLVASLIKGARALCVGTTSGELLSITLSAAEAIAPEPQIEAPATIEAAPIEIEAAPPIEIEAAPIELEAAPIEEKTPTIEAETPPAEAEAAPPIAEVIAFESLAAEPVIGEAEPPIAEAEPAPFAEPAPDFAAKIAEFEAQLAGLREALATVEAAGARERLDAAEDRARLIRTHEDARENDRAEAAQDKARALAELEATRWKDRADAAEDKARALAESEAAREKDRADAAEDKARALAEAAERAGRELAAVVRAEREEGELALSDRGRSLEAAKALAIRTLEEEHAAALARVEQSHELALASRDEATTALKLRLEEEHRALAAELDATTRHLGAELERALASEAETAARARHLASEHAEALTLRGEVERLRAESTRHKAELAARKLEIDQLEDAVSRERERAITAERAGEGVINVERAREKLGGVLDRVRSELAKRR
ncbi:MAG: hypothetical protein ABJE95_15320 [Byssovorax sp.]